MADRILRVGGCSGFLRRRSAGAPSADEDEVADAACLEEILGDTMSFAVDLLEARPGDTAAALAQAAAGLPRHGLVRLACGDRPLAPSETLAEAGVLDGAAVFAAVRSEEAFWRAAREELLERREEGLSQPCLGPADGGRLVATVGELCQAFEAGGQLDRVLALLGQALALLQAGASTEAFQSFRGYNGYGDVEGDGHNLACLFRHCVLAIDGLFAEGAAGAARLLRSCAELFEALVVAPGTAVRDNSCGIPVEYYHNYEGLLGTVSEMCRALFRHGGFVDPAHCHIVSFRPRQVYRPVETAAALGFAWRVLELQLLVEGEGPELTVPRRSCSLYPRVACLDLFYSVVDAETAELPPVAISPLHRQLRERAARLAVFCGRAEAIAEDVARLRRWHASANGCQFFLGNRPQWNEGDAGLPRAAPGPRGRGPGVGRRGGGGGARGRDAEVPGARWCRGGGGRTSRRRPPDLSPPEVLRQGGRRYRVCTRLRSPGTPAAAGAPARRSRLPLRAGPAPPAPAAGAAAGAGAAAAGGAAPAGGGPSRLGLSAAWPDPRHRQGAAALRRLPSWRSSSAGPRCRRQRVATPPGAPRRVPSCVIGAEPPRAGDSGRGLAGGGIPETGRKWRRPLGLQNASCGSRRRGSWLGERWGSQNGASAVDLLQRNTLYGLVLVPKSMQMNPFLELELGAAPSGAADGTVGAL